MNNEKINSKIKLSNNSSFVILSFVIFKFRNIGRSTFLRSKFWAPPETIRKKKDARLVNRKLLDVKKKIDDRKATEHKHDRR